MNHQDLDRERKYRIAERLAISCGDKVPTKQERDRAEREVENDMKRIEFDKVLEGWGV